jgi:BMFP domain-containing protein YqiC
MSDNPLLRELSERLAKIAPMADDLREDACTRIEHVLKKSLQDLDVLTREDFEVQTRALERAEQRIAELEQTLSAMEARLNAMTAAATEGTAD